MCPILSLIRLKISYLEYLSDTRNILNTNTFLILKPHIFHCKENLREIR